MLLLSSMAKGRSSLSRGHTLDEVIMKRVIAPVSQPTEWVLFSTYLHKPDGTLNICLKLKDLKKATV